MNTNMNENLNTMNHEEFFELEVNGHIEKVTSSQAVELGFVQCAECGEWVPKDSVVLSSNGYICEDCAEENYFRCDHCGVFHPLDEAVTVDEGLWSEAIVCEECADDCYYRCDDCGAYFSGNNTHRDLYGNCVCDHCFEYNDWCTCDQCGRILQMDDAIWDEYNEEYYCDDCNARRRNRSFHDYYYKPEPEFKFTGMDNRSKYACYSNTLVFGVELEVDDGDYHMDLCEDLVKLSQPIYMKHDGSLGDEGVEIVTHPCSLDYHLHELRWDNIIETCRDHKFLSHDAKTCGLHVHIGRDAMGTNGWSRNRTAGNLVLLVHHLWDDMVKFSRRTNRQLTEWANKADLWRIFNDDGVTPNPDLSDDDLTRIALDTEENGRYQAVNLCNSNTVELRLFRGTLKLNTLLATFQLVNNLTKYAMEHTPTECLEATMADVVNAQKFEELDAYCKERNIR